MRHHFNRCLHQLRQWHSSPKTRHDSRATSSPSAPKALEQAVELDTQTSWPTHRIRSFLLMQGSSKNAE